MRMLIHFVLLFIVAGCEQNADSNKASETVTKPPSYSNDYNPYAHILSIPLPTGYSRVKYERGSFAEWLRKLPLKKIRTVYKFNGIAKGNQSAQFAVVDITVGDKDLQQCADAAMRLRAEYLFAGERFTEIDFIDNAGRHYKPPSPCSKLQWTRYLETVFGWCGTLSLEKQMKPVHNLNALQPGDVLIKGGSPGHAMMVADIAVNSNGEKIYLLLQSYMPAQDIHIVKNPMDESLSPWYKLNENEVINTPEWDFTSKMFRTW